MPLITSPYNPPLAFKHSHVSTVYNGLFRKVTGLRQERERLTLPDGDFLDLDWSYAIKKSKKVVVIVHGLEGNAQRAYVQGIAKVLVTHGYDVCAINLRGCSGQPNLLFRSYHSGATDDLDMVLTAILLLRKYGDIFLTGFSLGGNLILKYLGEQRLVASEIKGAMAISVPCDLADCLTQLLKPKNFLYAERFRRNLVGKLKEKHLQFPDKISTNDIAKIKTLKDFDDIYTSKANGFYDAMDYYTKCSCNQFLHNIKVPALILNAENDTFLGPDCYPIAVARKSHSLHLEIPKYGGHVGFYGKKSTYAEKRAVAFFNTL